MNFYALVYKPFHVLSQFTSGEGKQTLKDFFVVPRDVYPVGRLDYDSEGLLLLTNDSGLNHRLLNPKFEHVRQYLVQVDGAMTNAASARLEAGVLISIDGKPYRTKKCSASLLEAAPLLPPRIPPVRFRKSIPTSWVKLELTEGKNRQVRKMTAAVGFPTLRLVRYAIEQCTIDGFGSGEMRIVSRAEIYQQLFPG